MEDLLEQLSIAGRRIAAAAEHGLGNDVPSCTGWTLDRLVRHVGETQRWANTIVSEARNGRNRDMFAAAAPWGEAAARVPVSNLAEWLIAGLDQLIASFRQAPPDQDFWTFMPGSTPLRSWARRQAHEAAVHAIDAQLAITTPDDVAQLPAWFAADGIDELVTGFVSRPGAAGARSAEPCTMLVAPVDEPGRWLIAIGPERIDTSRAQDDTVADATMSGTAHDLYSALWNRSPIDRVDIEGDAAVPAIWAQGVRIT